MNTTQITSSRESELNERLIEVTDINPPQTSFATILDDKDNKVRRYALKNILKHLQNVFERYPSAQQSCLEYINNLDKINILSFGQIPENDINIIVFSLIESIFQHRIKEHKIPIASSCSPRISVAKSVVISATSRFPLYPALLFIT